MGPYTLADDLASSEFSSMNLGAAGKPVLMGEFGAFKNVYGCNPSDGLTAALAMRNYRTEAKNSGFKGALYWTWNTIYPDDSSICGQKQQWWNGVDESGAINWELHWAW